MSESPSLEELHSRARGGEPQSKVVRARALDLQGQAEQALRWLRAAATGGSSEGAALLGVWELLARNVAALVDTPAGPKKDGRN